MTNCIAVRTQHPKLEQLELGTESHCQIVRHGVMVESAAAAAAEPSLRRNMVLERRNLSSACHTVIKATRSTTGLSGTSHDSTDMTYMEISQAIEEPKMNGLL